MVQNVFYFRCRGRYRFSLLLRIDQPLRDGAESLVSCTDLRL